MQDAHPVVLLAEVGQVEVCSQSPGQELGVLYGCVVNQGDRLGQTVLVGEGVGGVSVEMLGTGRHHIFAQRVEPVEQFLVEFPQNIPKQSQAQCHILTQ